MVNTRNINPRTRDTDRLAHLVSAANGFLAQHGDEPFFLFLHTYEPHTPYNPPARFIEQVRALDTGGDTVKLDAPLIESQPGVGVPGESWVANDRRVMYAAEVRYVDDCVPRRHREETGM